MIKKPIVNLIKPVEPVKPTHSTLVICEGSYSEYDDHDIPEGATNFEFELYGGSGNAEIKFTRKVEVTEEDLRNYEKEYAAYLVRLHSYNNDVKIWNAYLKEKRKEESVEAEEKERKLLEELKKKYEKDL